MLAGCYSGAAGIIVLLIAKIYKKMYFRNLPFRVIVPICYLMRLNVVFFGLIRQQKNCGKKIHSRILFLGFEYFNADYFSDLSILTRFISRI